MSIIRRIILSAIFCLTAIPMASAQIVPSALHTVGTYQQQAAEYQVGYTTGLIDMVYWMLAEAPATKTTVDACTAGNGDVDTSIMFDNIIAGGEFDEFPAAPVFVTLLNTTCSTQVATRIFSDTTPVAVGDGRPDAGGGAAAGAEGCVPVSTLPDGLLLLLARSGQLTALYEEGALC
jgi:hypothetical protein